MYFQVPNLLILKLSEYFNARSFFVLTLSIVISELLSPTTDIEYILYQNTVYFSRD